MKNDPESVAWREKMKASLSYEPKTEAITPLVKSDVEATPQVDYAEVPPAATVKLLDSIDKSLGAEKHLESIDKSLARCWRISENGWISQSPGNRSAG